MIAYIKLSIAALLPVLLSVILYVLQKRSKAFNRLPYMAQQVIIGTAFGALACLGTHWGIEMHGAMVNARDAAVLISGLMFGSPAGIIAGIIGGLERFLATQLWGIGEYTVIACSVSTFLAGIYAAALRRYMFEDKKPGWLISLSIGIIMEVFHLTMVFVTNLTSPEKAMNVVKACTAPMLIANGLSVMLSAMIISLLAHEKGRKFAKSSIVKISQTIQRKMLIIVTCTFAVAFVFVFLFQTGVAKDQADSYLGMAIEEVTKDISDTSDNYILRIAKAAALEYKDGASLAKIVKEYDLTEAHFINQDGIISDSSDQQYLDYDMASAAQSAEFLTVLYGKEYYVQPMKKMGYDNQTLRKYAAVKMGDGCFQIGYDVEKFHTIISESVIGITKNRHVGETGFVIILDSNYAPVSIPEGFDMAKLDSQADILENSKEGQTFKMTLGEEKVFARATKTEGFAIISVFPESEAYASRTVAQYINSFILILVFALMFAFIYFVIKRAVVNQIKRVNDSLSKITKGQLNEVVDVRTSEEFASLSDDINATVTALKGYIAEAEKRMEEELEFAHTIQHAALPSLLPLQKKFDVYASMDTAKEVGGDFYDFYLSEGDKKLCLLIADVSGKGIPAAMFMMRAKSVLKSMTDSGISITEAFDAANDTLCEGNEAGMFVTVWEGKIDLDSGKMSFVSAGHNPPVVRRSGGNFEFVRERASLVLAGMAGIHYKEKNLTLQKGDQIFLYTDGVTEAINPQKELFGEDRLLMALNSAEDSSAEGLCKAVKAAVDKFCAGEAQFDDITMLAYTHEGKQSEAENANA
ncbi:MAG: SpoIIE family protein phosphatase [Clostridia bacterium]|nr:SpoIIE family protein phosphatase [Clostridia bacterium]